MGCSPPGSFVPRISQARILSFPSPGDLPDPRIEPMHWKANSLPLSHYRSPYINYTSIKKKIKFKKPNILRKEILFSAVSLCYFVLVVLFILLVFCFVFFSAFYIYLLSICWGKYNAFKKRYRYSPSSECNGENNNLI